MTKRFKQENQAIGTFLAFALVPISGFAMDVYIPSFPHMASDLHTSASTIRLTLTLFLISFGVSQLFVGSILDSFGRYRIGNLSLAIFVLSSLGIATSHDISLIVLLRFIQGIVISFIVVCKRAFFIDVFKGEKRKHYTSMITVVWSTAPILAPFLGGFLQENYGWRANFYFLAFYGLMMLLLELKFSGETIVSRQPFQFKHIFNIYKYLLNAADFSLGIIVLGLSYGMVMVFAMSIPFIVEHEYHLSAMYSGYCALLSGLAIFSGGFLGKKWVDKPIYRKLQLANIWQLVVVAFMLFTATIIHSLFPMMLFIFLIHFWEGFTYNTYFTFVLTREPQYAAISSGLASGGSYIIFSLASYVLTHLISLQGQASLGMSYLSFLLAIQCFLIFGRKALRSL